MTNTDTSRFTEIVGDLEFRLAEEYPRENDLPQFIPSRFPYTYAADCLRQFPNLVPVAYRGLAAWPPSSRGDAAYLETAWAIGEDLQRGLLAVALATVFCRREGVVITSSRYAEVMSEIREGRHV